MKKDLLKLLKMNRSRGWKLTDMLKYLRLERSTYYRILNKKDKPEHRRYAENIMDIEEYIRLEGAIDELLGR